MEKKICKKCLLHSRIPGVTIDQKELCSVCSRKYIQKALNRYQLARNEAKQFEMSSRNHGTYDCMLMLSGGKDSIYMLYQLWKKKYRVLPFTFEQVYESSFALENAKLVTQTLQMEHEIYTPDLKTYRKMMSKVFQLPQEEAEKYSVKAPCAVCNALMDLAAFATAVEKRIPYILYCADPFQIMTISKDSKELIRTMEEMCGSELLEEFFSESMLSYIKQEEDKNLPTIIYPYATYMKYDGAAMVEELKAVGLMKNRPEQTHCQLWSLLQYYSYRNFDTFYYAEEIAAEVRNGTKDRDTWLQYFEQYKDVILRAAEKENLEPEDITYMEEVIRARGGEEQDVSSELENIVSLKRFMKEFEIEV